ncbi:bifunctional 5,10-methylenetetrahydrofolate dehydrogenase/5,10-methenyltetrahydrofolate cyclohydrolase [Lactobacillus sp. Sy-1]|uniref:bifunctional 5,10-methylenetetrahydrofolate dehydrogenase/5,10-methenyltetrahydrofolate cyclohydrolase n=1 Tax=Lactobacillus sp. Sy-1 TaxID=2109645 RepID=UPI001C5929BD|nr:bifunctional 5,10-methylenetetrahydrofolate dehydrogenase/5,10-methenyltetrahydrofolate cyclohydrolase [Lactobacillus sp. Sy-1]MBW1605643.1 bifunctional 5,10-methylenetetrahydrofolate dehydrogenase/5,10-methenyltetrahydrofolate cyclohydrolase [Lactobacillus sp. Sy-1]
MAQIIDGRALAKKTNDETKQMVTELHSLGIKPCLAVILVGDDQASARYVRNKHKKAEQLGIESIVNHLPAETTQTELLKVVNQYNEDPTVDGILVQSPLPKHIDEQLITRTIKPEKDVDGFHPVNVGNLFLNEPKHYPVACTPKGVMAMFEEYQIDLTGKKAVVIGRSSIVGRPMAALLINANATVTVLNHYSEDSKSFIKQADIVIAATGKLHMVSGDDLKVGATVIDVGQNLNEAGKLVGDVDYDSAEKVAGYITPVPGGVGPMTIAILMRQTVELATWSAKDDH